MAEQIQIEIEFSNWT